jgi:transposase
MSRASSFSIILHEHAPELSIAADLACRFAAMTRVDDAAGLDQWIEDAMNSELASFAVGSAAT